MIFQKKEKGKMENNHSSLFFKHGRTRERRTHFCSARLLAVGAPGTCSLRVSSSSSAHDLRSRSSTCPQDMQARGRRLRQKEETKEKGI
jgi:hypothetical protein